MAGARGYDEDRRIWRGPEDLARTGGHGEDQRIWAATGEKTWPGNKKRKK